MCVCVCVCDKESLYSRGDPGSHGVLNIRRSCRFLLGPRPFIQVLYILGFLAERHVTSIPSQVFYALCNAKQRGGGSETPLHMWKLSDGMACGLWTWMQGCHNWIGQRCTSDKTNTHTYVFLIRVLIHSELGHRCVAWPIGVYNFRNSIIGGSGASSHQNRVYVVVVVVVEAVTQQLASSLMVDNVSPSNVCFTINTAASRDSRQNTSTKPTDRHGYCQK